MLTFILIFLAVVAAYYVLGTPLLSVIHQFTEQFTRSFPLWAFFLPVSMPAGKATETRGRRRRRASPAAREGTSRFR